MRKFLIFLAALALSAALPAAAQKPDVTGGAVVASEPGKAVVARTVQVTAQVTAIDKASRTVTLKGPEGNVVDIVAGDEVRNFAQIKVGDMVAVRFLQSLTLELVKVAPGTPQGITETTKAVRAQPGQKPGAAAARQVTAIADVTKVDPKAKTITLKGPKREVTLDVQNPDQFKVVKVGDKVQVTYTEAVAISVEPAPKAAPKK